MGTKTRILACGLWLAASGCASSYASGYGNRMVVEDVTIPPPAPPAAPSGPSHFDFDSDDARGEVLATTSAGAAPSNEPASTVFAEESAGGEPERSQANYVASRSPQPTDPPPASATTTPSATSVDAPTHRDLIVYTARFVLAIYEVRETQNALTAATREAGGFVASLDARSITVRIPAERFDAFLTTIEGTGRVLDRSVQAEDVGEQYRDLQIRLENLVAMHDRLEQMLQRAVNVEEALAVERQLERVTVELESLRGRLRFLAERIAYSTITVSFSVLRRDPITAEAPTQLPVQWLQTLGLSNLLRN